MQEPQKIFFLCDGNIPECNKRMCFKNTNNNPCRWTSDIKHAKNFKANKGHGNYYEEGHEKRDTHNNDPNYFVIVAVSVITTIIIRILLFLLLG